MINDSDIFRERKERIEMHKRSLEDGSLRNYSKSDEYKSPFAFQSIICLFIFAFILILKLTNIGITEDLRLTLSNQMEKDNLPQIMSFMKSAKNNFTFSPYESINGMEEIDEVENNIDENISDDIPSTQFIIDENMLSDIKDSTAFLEKE